jgi:hypothetical protein
MFLSVLGVYMLFLGLKVSYEHPFCLLYQGNLEKPKGAVVPFHFKVPVGNGKIYDIDSCRNYICGLKH